MNNSQQHDVGNEAGQESGRPVGYCQNCGKLLNQQTARIVGPAIYCEPCLAARLAGGPAPGGATGTSSGYGPVNAGTPGAWAAPPPTSPSPGLAALLGFIPGVGAMYNEQYAKGIVHLIVFAVLVTLASDVQGVFGLFVAGWEFYMVIEAHHTAKARRDGTTLPNPFGLNDIGERFGFGRAWPGTAEVGSVVHDAARTAAETFRASGAPVSAQNSTTSFSGSSGSEAGDFTSKQQSPDQTFPHYTDPAPESQQYQQTYGYPGAQRYGPPPVTPPYGSVYTSGYAAPFDQPGITPQQNRIPAGAVWLIGMGVFFLLATTGIFRGFGPHLLIGAILLGIGVWVFIRRMLESGATLTSDGTPLYGLRVIRSLRGSIWLAVVGLLFLFSNFRMFSWHRSWPWLIILAGIMMLLQRTAYNSAFPATPAYPSELWTPNPQAPTTAATPGPSSFTSIVPVPSGRDAADQPTKSDETKGGF